MTAVSAKKESAPLSLSDVPVSVGVPAKKAVPKPDGKAFLADSLPLNVKYSVAIEENGRLKAELERLRKTNAAQSAELDILRAKFLAKQVTLDG